MDLLSGVIAGATVEIVTLGIILAALVMAWMFTSGLIDEIGPAVGLFIALMVGTILPSLYIIYGVTSQ